MRTASGELRAVQRSRVKGYTEVMDWNTFWSIAPILTVVFCAVVPRIRRR